ncbi:minor tail protein [Streptomyces phage Zuko]|uniref:Minor tail protein n=1 Tax=Streptomyces phage Zuko TaxID=2601695 RepID=A0A5J6D713_9CAUD|nr:minor tail protein [Streptomyces phage Zuko]QEQ93597.1 minor tail protein [Streptomyces phage Zuko]
MGVTVTNLTLGPGELFKGAFGTTEPADSEVVNDMTGTTVSGSWTDCGGTQGGITLELNQEYTELEVDQVVDIPGRRLTKREFKLNTNLAEVTLENYQLASNGGTITTGSGYRTYEPTQDDSGDTPTYSALVFDGYGPNSKRRRVIARRVLNTATVGQEYMKDSQTLFPVEFSCHYVSKTIRPFRYIDQT